MSNVMEEFPHLNDLPVHELHARLQFLKGDGPTGQLSDDTLKELLAITRILRKRTTAPSAKPSSKKAAPPSLDAL